MCREFPNRTTDMYLCPSCGETIGYQDNNIVLVKCPKCGQEIDGSDFCGGKEVSPQENLQSYLELDDDSFAILMDELEKSIHL